jgi:hypothetical protein
MVRKLMIDLYEMANVPGNTGLFDVYAVVVRQMG